MQSTRVIEGITVYSDGEGPQSVVMLHGWPDTYRLWQPQVEALAPYLTCVRFTLPGFDDALPRRVYSLDETVERLRVIIDAVSPMQPVILMLHDWGCMFGYQFAMRYPSRVSHLIGLDIGDVDSRAYARSLALKAKAMIAGYQLWLVAAWVVGGAVGDRMTRFMARLLHCRSSPAFISSRMNYPYYIAWTRAGGSYRKRLPFRPRCPMFYAYGAAKPFMFHSPGWLLWLAQQPASRVVAWPAGHWFMRSQAEAFNTALLAWLFEHALTAQAALAPPH